MRKTEHWGHWWTVCTAIFAPDGTATVVPVEPPYGTRQWACESLIKHNRAADGRMYCIMETDAQWPCQWEAATYGREGTGTY